MLYAAAWKAAKAIGYRRLISYTLMTESGSSLKALGWRQMRNRGGKSWNRGKRKGKRHDASTTYLKKTRWEISLDDTLPFFSVTFPKISRADETE
jgi:hypothetical protein